MTKQILKIILLVAFAGLAGCSSSVSITSIITTPTQSLPAPGNPRKSDCGGVYYTCVNFYTNNDGSRGFHVNTGSNYITVNSSTGTSPVPTSKYFVAAWDVPPLPAKPTTNCITANAAGQMCFIGSTNDVYLFTAFFKDTSYTNKPSVYMVIKPTP